ncbi:MAG: N-acetylglucosamine-6-phosphate deacetylase [Ornithinimicrobium sp.]
MTRAASTVVAAAAVVTPAAVLRPGWVEVTGSQITAVSEGAPSTAPQVSRGKGMLVPGFVDMHVHGGGGCSFGGTSSDEAARAAGWHRAQGSTTMLASLVSAPQEELVRQVAMLAELVQDGLLSGIHLEGPWLAPGKRGAHDPHTLRDPVAQEVDEVLRAGRGAVRMVTLAPERPGGLDAVRQLVAAGVVAAIGHTEADYEQTRAAIEAGASVATHLFNAMPAVHHRRPGPVPALLADDRVTAEVVADGLHVHPAILQWVLGTAGPTRVALVTDAMSAAGMGDGSYSLGGLPVQVRDGAARLADGTIAGSTATTTQLFTAARQALGETDEALIAASRVCSTTPAEALGLDGRGAIDVGRQADLVLLDDGGPASVLSAGEWVPAEPS